MAEVQGIITTEAAAAVSTVDDELSHSVSIRRERKRERGREGETDGPAPALLSRVSRVRGEERRV